MYQEIAFLITGGLISLITMVVVSILNHQLNRKHWLEQKEWDIKLERQRHLTGTLEDMQLVNKGELGVLRGDQYSQTQDEFLLPRQLSKVEIDTRKLIQALNKYDNTIEIDEIARLVLDSLDPETD